MFDWIECFIDEPILNDPRIVEFLEAWIIKKDLKYIPDVKKFIQKTNFKSIEKIVTCILYPLLGNRDYKIIINRIVIALLGLKEKWKSCFEGRKMKKIEFKENDEYENKLVVVLTSWAQQLNNSSA